MTRWLKMNENLRPRPFSIRLLETAILLQGISGVGGGTGLILDPSGDSLQIPIEWLDGSPFSSYLIPGVILFGALGIYPLVVLYIIRHRISGAWIGSVSVGAGLLVWIVVEIIVIGYQPTPPLQLIYGLLGTLIVVLAMVRSSRIYLQRRPGRRAGFSGDHDEGDGLSEERA
jgi:hypothetical protein